MWPFTRKPAEQRQRPATIDHRPDVEASGLVVKMAKAFIEALQATSPNWQRAFYRLEVSDVVHSSSGSFVTPTGVQIMDVFAFESLFEKLEPLGIKLAERTKPKDQPLCVLLLSAKSDFDYTIEFEWVNKDRWRITKMDGGTGLPEGK